MISSLTTNPLSPPIRQRLLCLGGLTLTLCLLIVFPQAAHAQSGQTTGKHGSIYFGALQPNGGSAKELKKIWTVIGLSFGSNGQSQPGSAQQETFVEYITASGKGQSANVYGIGYNGRSAVSSKGGGVTPYYGAGLGVYYLKVSGGEESGSRGGIGGRLNLGVDFQKSFFLQLGYNLMPSFHGINPTGFALEGGLRI